jgi:hypothetical protein
MLPALHSEPQAACASICTAACGRFSVDLQHNQMCQCWCAEAQMLSKEALGTSY